jgi:hypothetical protein
MKRISNSKKHLICHWLPHKVTVAAVLCDGFRNGPIGAGEVIELDREQLLGVVQTDAELSEILILGLHPSPRRADARGFGDVVLIGSRARPACSGARSTL